jgi:hypothetical protein
MAQRKPKTKKKSKEGRESGQRQKQKQTQRIIINLGEELAKRGGGGDGALIHSPLHTPWTMYDTGRLMTQEALNRNQMIQPEIPNGMPVMNVIGEAPWMCKHV